MTQVLMSTIIRMVIQINAIKVVILIIHNTSSSTNPKTITSNINHILSNSITNSTHNKINSSVANTATTNRRSKVNSTQV